MKGIIYFHQGWTDIINCLALITYYHKDFEELEVLVKEEAKGLVEFYIKNLGNVKGVYHIQCKLDSTDIGMLIDCKDKEFLFFGYHDHIPKRYGGEKYVLSFHKTRGFFVQTFYTAYDLDPDIRFTHFIFERDYALEEEAYQSFTEGETEYILHHNVEYRTTEWEGTVFSLDDHSLKTKIGDIEVKKHKSRCFFDYIKILENAKEMHLQDSSWANFVYILQKKYNLFAGIKITIYMRHREYIMMFPDLPENWNLKF